MKIAFFVPNNKIKNIDLSTVHKANPGIGGTEYAMFALCYYLSFFKDLELTIFCNAPLIGFSGNVNEVCVDNLQDALWETKKRFIDIFVLHHSEHSMYKDAFKIVEDTKISIIVWIHNFLSPKYLTYYNECKNIKRLVFVGKKFLEIYKDHLAYNKSTYIYNGIYVDENIKLPPYSERANDVIYIGNLIPGKGFHLLAKVWKKVLKEIPDAHLHVIGSGKLYDRSTKLGKYGYADSKYERRFMKYLTDKNGEQISSVTFHGIMGVDKNEVIKKCKVGIPNPSGYSETFGYTAVEMELMGCLITTIRCPGYIDTVAPTGILYKNPNELSLAIIQLLRRKDNNFSGTYKFINNHFNFKIIADQWRLLFKDIQSGYFPQKEVTCLLDRIRIIKSKYKFLSIFPTIYGVKSVIFQLKSLRFYWSLLKKII